MNITLEACFTIAIAVFFIAVFVPLMLRKIPMNGVYGFRTSESFKSDRNWYEINATSSRIVVYSIVPVLVIGVCKLFIAEHRFFYLNLAAFVLPLVIAAFMFRRIKRSQLQKFPEPGIYLVQLGDTAPLIANQLYMSFEELSALNPNVDWSHLKTGQRLRYIPPPMAHDNAA